MGAVLSDSEKVQVRRWLGFSYLFSQRFPKLEMAMNAIREVSDGGTQPDDSGVVLVQTMLTNLSGLETQMQSLYPQFEVEKAGIENVELNTGKALFLLRSEGRRYIGAISDVLSVRPNRDVFSAAQVGYDSGEEDDRFSNQGG